MVSAGEVKEIVVQRSDLTVTLNNGKKYKSKKENEGTLSETLKNFGVSESSISKANIKVENPSGLGYFLERFAPFLFPLLIFALLIYFFVRQSKGGMQAFSFGNSRAKFIDPRDSKNRITFKDVAGAKEAKAELKEIVDFLKFPKKYLDIGADIPKGVLLMGSPGTGKTLLARAVAGEARVPFYSVSGSEFVEMFVGVGASRVRDLFANAKKTAPSIVFIDEIDAIGRVRGGGTGGGNDEREQTLNQILVEMDGFENNQKVIVMAATNRAEVLDPALLRPGRFDRRVTIDLPDREDRLKILQVHAKKKPFAEDVDLKVIAERTPGFSGADLYSLMNESAILAASSNRSVICQDDLIKSIEKVMLGPERKSHILSEKEKIRTAYHEVGHALCASVSEYADPVHKVSIISRGKAAGYTMHLPFDDKKLHSRNDFLANIVVSLGGYVAEKMIFGDVTTGPSNDLQVSTALARQMVTEYGMSDKIGALALENEFASLPGHRTIQKNVNYSSETAKIIDEETSKIVNSCLKEAEGILKKHQKALHDISETLIKTEVLERAEFEKLLVKHKIKVKSKEDEEKRFVIKKPKSLMKKSSKDNN